VTDALTLARKLLEAEGVRYYAYPDPYSALGKATRGRPWGYKSAEEIFDTLPAAIAQLSPHPWTIGRGATGPGIDASTHWTPEQVEAALVKHLAVFQAGVRRLVKVPMTPNQEAALISFAYNVGLDEDADTIPEGLGDSTLLRLFNAGQTDLAANEFRHWTRAGGEHPKGLIERRENERMMFLGIYPGLGGPI
jgi:lysozyme